MHREEPVVDVGGEEVPLRRRELGADQDGHQAAEDEEERDAEEVEDADPLVVPRQEPRLHAVRGRSGSSAPRSRRGSRVRSRLASGGGAAAAAAAAPAGFRSLMYLMSWTISSSEIWSLKVGMIGWYPCTTFAAGLRIDSRT